MKTILSNAHNIRFIIEIFIIGRWVGENSYIMLKTQFVSILLVYNPTSFDYTCMDLMRTFKCTAIKIVSLIWSIQTGGVSANMTV